MTDSSSGAASAPSDSGDGCNRATACGAYGSAGSPPISQSVPLQPVSPLPETSGGTHMARSMTVLDESDVTGTVERSGGTVEYSTPGIREATNEPSSATILQPVVL